MVNKAQKLAFRERLDATLTERGKSWIGLRAHLKLTRTGIKKWRDGETIPSAAHLLITSDWLDVNPRWLLHGNAPQAALRSVTPDADALLRDYYKLSEPDRAAIRRHAASLRGRGDDHPPNSHDSPRLSASD